MGFEPHETVHAVFGGKAGDGARFVLPNAAREFEGRTDVESPIRFRGKEIDERHRADRNMGQGPEARGHPVHLIGSLRRQGSILQSLLRRSNGFLPTQEPRIAPRLYRIPAKAGIHPATAPSLAKWVPAFAGTPNCPARLSGPCEGRDPSCNRSFAGEKGSCRRREPRIAPRVCRIPTQAGIHPATAPSPVKRVPAGAGNLELPRAFVGSLRRQGSILQPLLRWRNGFLPSQEPRIAPRVYRIPAQAGIHPATARALAKWVPACAGTSNCPARLSDPGEGRDPSCNRSFAGAMGSCLRRNLELPRALTGSRRRQGSILQPLLRRRNGFLPSQEPRIAPRVCRVPAQAGIHRATARAPEQWGSCLRRNPDLRRMPATEIGLGIAPLYRIPAQAGIHRTTARLPVKRVPAGAGTSICPARLPDPGEGRDPSCNRSSAGDMGSCLRRNPSMCLPTGRRHVRPKICSCLRRNPELPRMAATAISSGIAPLYRIPAKAGIHRATARAQATWVPACAGTQACV